MDAMFDDVRLSATAEVLPEDRCVRVARHLVRETLLSWGVSDEAVWDAELLMSELITNAVQHAQHRDGDVLVACISVIHRHIWVGVWDPDPLNRPVARQAEATDESGRGLEIGRALAHRRVESTEFREGRPGKQVAYELVAAA